MSEGENTEATPRERGSEFVKTIKHIQEYTSQQ
jgi:hypothetical protein